MQNSFEIPRQEQPIRGFQDRKLKEPTFKELMAMERRLVSEAEITLHAMSSLITEPAQPETDLPLEFGQAA